MSGDNYSLRQRTMDEEYSRQYQEWVAGLPPEQRQALADEGIAAPDTAEKSSGHCGLNKDVADSPLASFTPDMAAQIDPPEEDAAPTPEQEARSDVLASFCAQIRSCPNPALALDTICYATGVSAIEGQSATELAAKHGVTKQAFSKMAVRWCETFGLPPSRSMKSKKAREVYRKRAKVVHEKYKLTRSRSA